MEKIIKRNLQINLLNKLFKLNKKIDNNNNNNNNNNKKIYIDSDTILIYD